MKAHNDKLNCIKCSDSLLNPPFNPPSDAMLMHTLGTGLNGICGKASVLHLSIEYAGGRGGEDPPSLFESFIISIIF